jgi:uncharacterized membrane protein YdjX (TVP38/TMEM64 family)
MIRICREGNMLDRDSSINTGSVSSARLISLVMIIVLAITSGTFVGVIDFSGASVLTQLTENNPSWAWIAFASFLLMLMCALTPLPAEAVALSNGVIFGPVAGFFLTWSSAMTGALVTFLLSRKMLARSDLPLQQLAKIKTAEKWVRRWGIQGLFLARLFPMVPFFALNIGAALFPVSTRSYLLVTGFAIAPHILLISYFGASLH